MSQKVSKEKAINTIKECQPLEVALTQVDRNDSASMKRQTGGFWIPVCI
jgi:hypothetical protein